MTGRIESLTPLAPLHQPKALLRHRRGPRRVRRDLPEVACFDTAFHAHIPAQAATYAIPRRVDAAAGACAASGSTASPTLTRPRRAAALLGAGHGELRIVTCHLGAGASLAAVRDGRSVDTTMGYTPLEGLVDGHPLRRHGPGPAALGAGDAGAVGRSELADVLTNGGRPARHDRDRGHARRSSSGRRPATPTPRWRSRCTCTACAACIARMTASLGGLDVLVFTGGVGENGVEVRRRTAEGLGYLGVALDAAANAPARPIGRSAPPAPPSGRSWSPRAKTSRSRARRGPSCVLPARAASSRSGPRASLGKLTRQQTKDGKGRRSGRTAGPFVRAAGRVSDGGNRRARPCRGQRCTGTESASAQMVASAGSGSANRTVER